MRKSVTKNVLVLLLALSLSACLLESEPDETESGDVSLSITSPISTSEMDTTDPSVSLAGTATSGMGISKVSWTSDRGREGVADGTDLWKTGAIDLELGENKIDITAEDTTGAKSSQSVRIKRESGQKGSATLSWSAPTERTDGSALTNLAGYKIFYGRMTGVYDYQIDIDTPGVSTYVVEDLVSGDWYFALAAYDSAGLESDRSNEAVRNVR